MYSLPDFNNIQTSHGKYTNSDTASFQYPPPSSSPFVTLGSGFSEKIGIRRAPGEQHYIQHSGSNRKPGFIARDPNKYRFSCDTCNRSFLYQNHLDKHIAEHVKCDFEGCFFEGHAKMLELHTKMQHYTGLATVISKLNTPEEIKKWRDERRKNFPTAANIKRRQEEQAERMARGEVLDKTNFRKGRKWQVRNHADNDKSFGKRRRRRRQKFKKGARNVSSQSLDSTVGNTRFPLQKTYNSNYNSQKQTQKADIKNVLIKFPGTKAIEMNDETDKGSKQCQDNFQQQNNEVTLKEDNSNNFIDSDVEYIEQNCAKNTDQLPCINISDSEVEDTHIAQTSNNSISKSSNVTSHICEMKDSNEYCENSTFGRGNASALSFFVADKEVADSEDESPIPQKAVKSEPSEDLSIPTKVGGALGSLMAAYDSESENESKDEPIAKPLEKQPILKKQDDCTKQSVNESHAKDNQYASPHISQRRLTLLEKLLANEIRHERNVIFQCINYVVRNNFFEENK